MTNLSPGQGEGIDAKMFAVGESRILGHGKSRSSCAAFCLAGLKQEGAPCRLREVGRSQCSEDTSQVLKSLWSPGECPP